jgi:hypothetical protein
MTLSAVEPGVRYATPGLPGHASTVRTADPGSSRGRPQPPQQLGGHRRAIESRRGERQRLTTYGEHAVKPPFGVASLPDVVGRAEATTTGTHVVIRRVGREIADAEPACPVVADTSASLSGDRVLVVSPSRLHATRAPQQRKTGKSKTWCGIPRCETRTRTGDTTIFRRALSTSESGRFAGLSRRSRRK